MSSDNEERSKLEQELQAANQRINELTALCYQVTNHFEIEFFNNQSIVRAIRDKLIMTPEVWELVHRSEEHKNNT